ncbi:ketopantoate reductase PanE/ApbA [Haematococcus lacustris]|uniref:Ketopantoate reductase PanE/ApbA n=1 Tax=Haematococcus lacustris TaxID=44745 RepID=A0A699YQL4_HAELA|nr:ketopantoate reductase PanE/ApbA [Haematococcus lacustris]
MPPLTPRGVAPLHRTVTPVHILGAGSLGLFFAQALRQAGVPVTLHVRSSKAISILQHGPLLLEQRFKGASELLAVKDVTVGAAPGQLAHPLLPACHLHAEQVP